MLFLAQEKIFERIQIEFGRNDTTDLLKGKKDLYAIDQNLPVRPPRNPDKKCLYINIICL